MNYYMRTMKAALCAALVAGAVFATGAQDMTTGSISGTITDPSGAAVKGATVKLINTDRGETVRTLTTNSAGFYTGTALPLGTYTVQVIDQGFRTVDVKGLGLHVNDALTFSRALVPGGVNETVEVAADKVQINLE